MKIILIAVLTAALALCQIKPKIDNSLDQAGVSSATIQAGTPLLCSSSTGSDTYTCGMTPALTAYTSGMIVNFVATATGNTGAATINIDSLGAKAIKMPDGTTDPATGTITAGRYYHLTYDGTVFRLLQTSSGTTTAIQKGNGAGRLTDATANSDYVRGAIATLTNTATSCPVAETQIGTLTATTGTYSAGDTFRVTLFWGKTVSAGNFTLRIRHTNVAGTVLASGSAATTEVGMRGYLEFLQSTSTSASAYGATVRENTTLTNTVNSALTQNTSSDMVLSITAAGCAGAETVWIRNATLEIIRAAS